jgi:cytochrome b561
VGLPGLGHLPALIGRDLDLADTLEDWHSALAWTLLALIALHVAAALWHQYIRRDGLLDAMWPRRR